MREAPETQGTGPVLTTLKTSLSGARVRAAATGIEVEVEREELLAAAGILAGSGYALGGIVAEWTDGGAVLRYPFHALGHRGIVQVIYRCREGMPVPSISPAIYAADWYEREVEDLFELRFEGHPLLGDFVLHNEDWPEGVAPMRPGAMDPSPSSGDGDAWRPRRFVESEGAFSMTVGPVFSGAAESVQFRLESEGEEVLHAGTRLFYKFRGLEKLSEGRSAADALLLAERLNGTSAVAHALACAQAAEAITVLPVPPRARALRTVLAELERLRHHMSTVEGLVASTGLSVPAALLSAEVERLLRLSAVVTGHRYLFGAVRLGGVGLDLTPEAGAALRRGVLAASRAIRDIADGLAADNAFLDRVEEVGTLRGDEARHFGLVGPPARAGGLPADLRAVHPYAGYDGLEVRTGRAAEGDIHARFRLLVDEMRESARIVVEVMERLPEGPVGVPWSGGEGAALGWAEAPTGPAFHWLRTAPDGTVKRWRVMPPSFANWRALAPAVEHFASQDFPIILASYGLSVAEADR